MVSQLALWNLLRGAIHPAVAPIKVGEEVAARLRRLVVTAPTSVGAPAPETALKELLRGRGVCEVAPSGVDLAPYRSNLVSLPADLEGSPNLADLLPPDARVFLDGEHELMRRTREETRALVEDGGVVRPSMDSALRHNKKRYLTLLRQLRSRGMLNFVEQAKARAGEFFCLEVLQKTSCDSLSMVDREICSSRFLLQWACVLLRLFPESRLSVMIIGLLMENRFLLLFQGSAWHWDWQMSPIASTA